VDRGLKILFHAQDEIAQPDIAIASVEEGSAVVAGIEGRLGIKDVVDRELEGEAAEVGAFVPGAKIVRQVDVVIGLRLDRVPALRADAGMRARARRMAEAWVGSAVDAWQGDRATT